MDDSIKKMFHLGPKRNQFDRSNAFIKGLERASDEWTKVFRIDDKGLVKPSWSLDPENAEVRENETESRSRRLANGIVDTNRADKRIWLYFRGVQNSCQEFERIS